MSAQGDGEMPQADRSDHGASMARKDEMPQAASVSGTPEVELRRLTVLFAKQAPSSDHGVHTSAVPTAHIVQNDTEMPQATTSNGSVSGCIGGN